MTNQDSLLQFIRSMSVGEIQKLTVSGPSTADHASPRIQARKGQIRDLLISELEKALVHVRNLKGVDR